MSLKLSFLLLFVVLISILTFTPAYAQVCDSNNASCSQCCPDFSCGGSQSCNVRFENNGFECYCDGLTGGAVAGGYYSGYSTRGTIYSRQSPAIQLQQMTVLGPNGQPMVVYAPGQAVYAAQPVAEAQPYTGTAYSTGVPVGSPPIYDAIPIDPSPAYSSQDRFDASKNPNATVATLPVEEDDAKMNNRRGGGADLESGSTAFEHRNQPSSAPDAEETYEN